ncbi:caspase domain-containing protein [Streptomyces sp. Ag109_O5-1]|nr:caspase domain-containing protein [Streptomyces sp. Ag109_O5-1]
MTMPWLTRLIDSERSWAVLMGTSRHTPASGLSAIPQADSSIDDLATALSGAWGLFEKERVLKIVDPSSTDEVLSTLDHMAGSAPDVVLFYYVGHGMDCSGEESGRRELFLALTGSVDNGTEAVRTGLPVSSVLSRLHCLRAKQTVVVLDCCFASRALDSPGAGNMHLLCATDRVKPARYQLTDRHTGFTGSLLRLFENGIPDGPEYLDLHTVFQHLSVVLPTTRNATPQDANGKLPRPHQRTSDHHGRLALVRNPAYGTALTPEGLAARSEFALRVNELGRDPLVEPGDQRMWLAHAAELFAKIAADTASLRQGDG